MSHRDASDGLEQVLAWAGGECKKYAVQGNDRAQLVLGAEKNEVAAREWLAKAAAQDNAYAQHVLEGPRQAGTEAEKLGGHSHMDVSGEPGVRGQSVNTSHANALQQPPQAMGQDVASIRNAAERGNAKAQYALGRLYRDGQGVSQDEAEVAQWFQKAAQKGYADAQYSLGMCYEHGIGVKIDMADGARWYKKAAKLDDADAQRNLAVCTSLGEYGQRVPRDWKEARKWFEKWAG